MVVVRRQVLVQMDDEMVAELDRLAARRGTSRSDLVRRGVLAVLQAADVEEADRALREAYRRVPPDPALVESAGKLAGRTAPSW